MAVTSTSNANMSNKYSGDLLHAGPRVTATPLLRLAGVAHAAMMLSLLYLFGLPGGFLAQAQAALSVAVQQRRRPLQAGLAIAAVLLSPGAWRDAIVSHGLPVLLRMSDDNFAPIKRLAIFPHARGKVLELGAGTGMTCKYYDADKVSAGIEGGGGSVRRRASAPEHPAHPFSHFLPPGRFQISFTNSSPWPPRRSPSSSLWSP